MQGVGSSYRSPGIPLRTVSGPNGPEAMGAKT